MSLDERVQELQTLVANHEAWRRRCANLIASENVLSPMVRSFLDSDLVQRYGDYLGRNLSSRKYFGNAFIEELERQVVSLAQEVFGASEVELRAISGHVAGISVLMGLLEPGDTVLEVGSDGGGHRLAAKFAESPLVKLNVGLLPFDGLRYNVDVERAEELIRELRPKMIILGSSNFLFPHPVRRIRGILHSFPETILAYDASHVLGLLAGKRFQSPLEEGADIVFGSTHKTFPGPQGGIILSNNKEIMDRVSAALYPSVVTNHHLFRLPSLGVALVEMLKFGPLYADAVVKNAEALASSIEAHGVEVLSYSGRHTMSHTILVKVAPYGKGIDIARRLESCGIIVTHTKLPAEHGVEGLRIGVQEITRLGAKEEDASRLGELVSGVITGTARLEDVREAVAELASRWNTVRFC